MSTRFGSVLSLAALASLVFVAIPAQASAHSPDQPTTCTVPVPTRPSLDGGVIHSTGQVICDAPTIWLDGRMQLLRDGVVVWSTDFGFDFTSEVGIVPQIPCINGTYEATMFGHWVPYAGPEGSASATSQAATIVC
jgi:hypothetical protein